MSRVLSSRHVDLKNISEKLKLQREKQQASSRFTFIRENKTSAGIIKISLAAGVFVVILAILISGGLYIYQVNSVATKGYDLKELEQKIKKLDQENQNLKIKEVELKSMYHIEKSVQDSDLVTATEISYLEIPSPVAMK